MFSKAKTISAYLTEKGLSVSQISQLNKHILNDLLSLNIIEDNTFNNRDKYNVSDELALNQYLQNNQYYNFYIEKNKYSQLKYLFIEEGLEVNLNIVKRKLANKIDELITEGSIKRILNTDTKCSILVVLNRQRVLDVLSVVFHSRSQYVKQIKVNEYLKNHIGFNEIYCERFKNDIPKNQLLGVVRGRITDLNLFNQQLHSTPTYQFSQASSTYKTLNGFLGQYENKTTMFTIYTNNKQQFLEEGISISIMLSNKNERTFIVNEDLFLSKINNFLFR